MSGLKGSDVVAILSLAVTYGIPAVRDIIQTWSKETVSLDELRALFEDIKAPEDY